MKPLIIAVIPLLSLNARAESSPWWHLALGPAYFFIQTNIHEGSHVLTAAMVGADVTDYAPWPHMHRGKFFFGRFSARDTISGKDWAIVQSAPLLTDTVLFLATDMGLSLMDGDASESFGAQMLFFAGMVAPAVDFFVNLGPAGDEVGAVSHGTGVNAWVLSGIGLAMTGVAAWRIIHHARQLFGDKRKRTGSKQLIISPATRFTGVQIAYSW